VSSPARALAALVLLFACATSSFAQGEAGGTYRRPIGHDPQTLDPARVGDIYGLTVTQQVFDGLVQFDATLMVVPALAEFWKASRDGLTWTFTLRKGVHFHHGRELTADDVVYSFTRILDPATRSGAADLFLNIVGAREFREGRAEVVRGLRALDRFTVQVTLTETTVPFVSLLGIGHAKIVPRDVVTKEGPAFGTRPVGTGPFRFVRWDREKDIVLAANEGYFGGPSRLARVVFRIFPGHRWDEAFQEFQKRNLEDTVPPSRGYRDVIHDPRWAYVKRPMISIRFYGLNTRIKPLDDRRVRLALTHAVDAAALIREVHQGRDTVARGILPPGTLGYNPALHRHEFSPERARQLLAQAGYPGGRGLPSITITSSVNSEPFLREHDFIRRALAAVGVKVEFAYLTDWPAFSAALAERRLQSFMYAWYADVPDPDNFLSKLFHSKSPRNLFAYENPAVDVLLTRARNETDVQRRIDAYRRAEEQILDDAPLIPILHHTYERLFQPYVRGIEVNGLGDPYLDLRKMSLERQ
jgi:peptide/nickel transport system substrate-binding protein/oligopeptide transport system substrate-binding protein